MTRVLVRRVVPSIAVLLVGCAASPPPPPAEPAPAVATSVVPAPAKTTPPAARPVATKPVEAKGPPEHREIALDVASIPGLEAALHEADISANELRDALISALQPGSGYLPYSAQRVLKASTKRSALVTGWFPMVKKVLSSPSFAEAWAQARREALWVPPIEDPPPPRTAAQIRDEQVAQIESQIQELERSANASKMTPQQRASVDQMIAQFRKLQDNYISGNSAEQIAENERMAAEIQRQQRPEQERQRDEEIARRRDAWPESPKAAAKKRLDEFIALCDSIDFNAQTVLRYTRRYFVSPEYEMKPSEWKLLFRAGKPMVSLLRGEALKWRNEL